MADTSLAQPLTLVGLDIGSSRLKIKTNDDLKLALASQVARDAGHVSRADPQLKAAHRPVQIKTDAGTFLVGPNAHAWGDRKEQHDVLDTQRLLGGPKIRALFYGALTALIHNAGAFTTPLAVCVGTPVGIDRTGRAQVESWLAGVHTWIADGVPMGATVQHAHTIPQTSAAVFEHVLTATGAKDKTREPKAGQTLLAVSGGLWDLQIEGREWDGKAWVEMPAVTHNWTYGSAELYRKFPRAGTRTIGAMDQAHLAGGLDDEAAREMWAGEVFQMLDDAVGAWDGFDLVIPYGGIMLMPAIQRRFAERLGDNYVKLADPLFAQASGMVKWLRAKYRQ